MLVWLVVCWGAKTTDKGKESMAVPTRDFFPDLFRAPGGAPAAAKCHRKGWFDAAGQREVWLSGHRTGGTPPLMFLSDAIDQVHCQSAQDQEDSHDNVEFELLRRHTSS